MLSLVDLSMNRLKHIYSHFMSNSTEDLSVVASKFEVWHVNFVWTSSRVRLSNVMLLNVTRLRPDCMEEELVVTGLFVAVEKIRPLRYHETRGGGLPATKKMMSYFFLCLFPCKRPFLLSTIDRKRGEHFQIIKMTESAIPTLFRS